MSGPDQDPIPPTTVQANTVPDDRPSIPAIPSFLLPKEAQQADTLPPLELNFGITKSKPEGDYRTLFGVDVEQALRPIIGDLSLDVVYDYTQEIATPERISNKMWNATGGQITARPEINAFKPDVTASFSSENPFGLPTGEVKFSVSFATGNTDVVHGVSFESKATTVGIATKF